MNSSYYPPRSRLPTRLVAPWFELKRLVRLDRIPAPGGISPLQWLLTLVVPAWAFVAMGRPGVARLAFAAYGTAFFLFVVFLGQLVANVSFGLLIAIHAMSLVWFVRMWIDRPPLWFRLALTGTVLLVVWQAIYSPIFRYIDANWFTPLSTSKGVVVIHRAKTPESVRIGDLAAYQIAAERTGNVSLQDGFGFNRVLAKGGDKVEFTPRAVLVNGEPRPRNIGMPLSGSLIVPEKHWFIWPNFDIELAGSATEQMGNSIWLRVAVVSESDYIGKPFRCWFGRRQMVP